MNIENILKEIKKEYEKLLDNDLENYLVEPATEEQIAEFSAKFDVELPEDFVQFLTKSDIKLALEGGYDTVDLERTENLLGRMNKSLEEGKFKGFEEQIDGEPSPLMQNVWWCTKWIPFAEDSGGNWLCIDLAPTEKGTIGQIIGFERGAGPFPMSFKSFTEFLAYQLKFTKNGGLSADGGCLS